MVPDCGGTGGMTTLQTKGATGGVCALERRCPGCVWEEHSGDIMEDRLERARRSAGDSCSSQKPKEEGPGQCRFGKAGCSRVSP